MEYVEDGPFTGFQKKKDHLVCIDSDGCAMDTMDIKLWSVHGKGVGAGKPGKGSSGPVE